MTPPCAYITGASSGIGRETAIQLARRGYRTVLMARRAHLLEELAVELRRWAPSEALPLDLSDARRIDAVVLPMLAKTGPVAVLVNCAGFGIYRPALQQTPGEMSRLMQVNHLAALTLARLVVPGMLKARQGHIFAVSSMSGRMGAWGHGGYAASKAAMRSATETLAAEYPFRETGVRFTIVYPGIVRTPYFDLPSLDLLWRRVQHRAIEPARVARAIAGGIGRGRLTMYVPWHYRLLDVIAAVSPDLALQLVRDGSRPPEGCPGPAPDAAAEEAAAVAA